MACLHFFSLVNWHHHPPKPYGVTGPILSALDPVITGCSLTMPGSRVLRLYVVHMKIQRLCPQGYVSSKPGGSIPAWAI